MVRSKGIGVEAQDEGRVSLICSVLLPTRSRVDRLHKTVASIFESLSDPSSTEVLLRVDDDDSETISRLGEFESYPCVRPFVGPRVPLYEWIVAYYDELSARAQAPWIWTMNDDAHFEGSGSGWDEELRRVSLEGFVVYAECFKWQPPNRPAPSITCADPRFGDHVICIPNHCWRAPDRPVDAPSPPWTKGPVPAWLQERLDADPEWAGLAKDGMIGCPADTWLDHWFLRAVRNWETRLLRGLTIAHMQDLPRLW